MEREPQREPHESKDEQLVCEPHESKERELIRTEQLGALHFGELQLQRKGSMRPIIEPGVFGRGKIGLGSGKNRFAACNLSSKHLIEFNGMFRNMCQIPESY